MSNMSKSKRTSLKDKISSLKGGIKSKVAVKAVKPKASVPAKKTKKDSKWKIFS